MSRESLYIDADYCIKNISMKSSRLINNAIIFFKNDKEFLRLDLDSKAIYLNSKYVKTDENIVNNLEDMLYLMATNLENN